MDTILTSRPFVVMTSIYVISAIAGYFLSPYAINLDFKSLLYAYHLPIYVALAICLLTHGTAKLLKVNKSMSLGAAAAVLSIITLYPAHAIALTVASSATNFQLCLAAFGAIFTLFIFLLLGYGKWEWFIETYFPAKA